jgi:serine/threonine protein kinase
MQCANMWTMFRQITSAVYSRHQNGIVHTSLKLLNLLVDTEWKVQFNEN